MKKTMVSPEGETFGERMKRTREQLRMSQAELARRIGMSAQYVNDMENGRRKMPRPPVAQRIAETLLWPEPYIWTYEDALRIVKAQWELMADSYALIARYSDEIPPDDATVSRVLVQLDKAIPDVIWEKR